MVEELPSIQPGRIIESCLYISSTYFRAFKDSKPVFTAFKTEKSSTEPEKCYRFCDFSPRPRKEIKKRLQVSRLQKNLQILEV